MSGLDDAPDEFEDFDDGDLGSTTVGTDLFGVRDVPAYPTVAQLGHFEILGRIARGGMAEVYLARERAADGTVRHVVVKRVLTEMQHDPAMLRMFLDEGQIAVRLFHPNVCHVYEVGDLDGQTFMALEWVHGTSLREVIRRAGAQGLPVPVVAHIIARVARALEYVHGARGIDGKPLSIIHQDVTPHNVMLSWKGHVKLLDFGIAKTTSGAQRGAPQGKFEYMAPEQVRQQPIDARVDVFALGVCLWEALVGRSPFARDGIPLILSAIVGEDAPLLRSVRPGLPAELEAIAARALAREPQARFQRAGELAQALDGFLAASGQVVGDARVALAIAGLFRADEKAPLQPSAVNLTGTLPALGALGEAADAPSWAQAFAHDEDVSDTAAHPSVPPPALEPSPEAAPAFAPAPSAGGALATAQIAPPVAPRARVRVGAGARRIAALVLIVVALALVGVLIGLSVRAVLGG